MPERREVLRNYPWSSYPDYAGLRRAPKWLTLGAIQEASGLSLRAYRRELDRRVTRDQLGLDWSRELVAGILMGTTAAVADWKRLLTNKGTTKTKRFGQVTWEEIIVAIEAQWGRPWAELSRKRGTGATGWAIWFGRHRAGLTLEQLRQKLGLRSYTAVAMQVGRLQRALATNAVLQRQQKALAKRLNVQC